MGRGRKGFVEQSVKKPKWYKKRKNFQMLKGTDVHYEKTVFFKEEFIEELKKMDPQYLMNVLLNS